MLTKGIKSGIIILHENHKCGRKTESKMKKNDKEKRDPSQAARTACKEER